jgi:hypothetical protein
MAGSRSGEPRSACYGFEMQRETKTTGKLDAGELQRLIADEQPPTALIERQQLLELVDRSSQTGHLSTEKQLAHTIGRDSHLVVSRPIGEAPPSALRGLVFLGIAAALVRFLIWAL